jgi:dihydropteroate synthase
MTGPSTPAWRITGGRLLTPAPFIIAGIVNTTPDSFSDGGKFFTLEDAVNRVRDIVAQGAHMVDLGAESTRPGAEDIGHAEEWRRLEPVLAQSLHLRDSKPGHCPFVVSIDTFRAETAVKALTMGADIINDVSGGSFDPGMDEALAAYKPGYVLGHSPARPDQMQQNPHYAHVVDELLRWFSTRMNALVKAGLPEECICLDPCIGFGKTLEHTLDIMAAIPRFLALGRPLYFGISRKSFIGAITGQSAQERDTSTQVATALLAQAGVHVHRVHQVADTVATLKLVQALKKRTGAQTSGSKAVNNNTR